MYREKEKASKMNSSASMINMSDLSFWSRSRSQSRSPNAKGNSSDAGSKGIKKTINSPHISILDSPGDTLEDTGGLMKQRTVIKGSKSCSRIDILVKMNELNKSRPDIKPTKLLTQFEKEKILFKMNYKLLLLTLIWQYVHSVATNVAYYLHVQRPPLTDLGFELLPALSKKTQVVSEVMFFICVLATIAYFVSPLFYPRRNLYLVLMLTRFAGTLVLAQTLRIGCFLVTTLPGPNYHCRPNSPDYAPPKSLMDIFGRQDAFFGCGDLVFSSHTIFVVLCALVWHKYCPFKWVRRVVWTLVFFFGLLVVAARKHYSLDIMVAWYTVPLLWVANDHYFPDKIPLDFEPFPDLQASKSSKYDLNRKPGHVAI
mmetsp:Transcript_32015/g.56208  ORF Transcript_32015/g.56208 Transcript_32015/m.56208 type:complete len:370 (+) Transcript_32015:71-1180(+)|eukprot:CAMPEP_0197542096 /NCGR_PEP_ID=MMETSP1318-20131121/67523_1 /TAXON_ID=552666 /ORGANISM="Partenskyella glossopodia, Strain RCC365" /LENGTH=369 /DNA_ID=CAMNT_0043101339 /DNA_START=656 /DNA_END=1765 /DNA_ORIENTATION=-